MAEQIVDRKAMVAALVKSTHGDLASYVVPATVAVAVDAEFFSHLIAWDHRKGQVRDAKVALPVIALRNENLPPVFRENALALLADLPPFLFVKAMDFARQTGAMDRTLRRLVERYLRDLEADRRTWDRVALQHRDDMRRLYGLFHIAPGGVKGSYEDVTLMRHQATTGKFSAVRDLAQAPASLIGATVQKYRLPFLIVRGALGARAKEQDVALALIKVMTPNELVTNMRALQRLGVKTDPVLRAALEEAIGKATAKPPKKGKGVTLKTTRAAEALKADGETVLSSKLHALQERQLQQLGGVEGHWLVLGDRSGSMSQEIEITRQVSAILARMVTGRVHVVFFDTAPRYFEATGQTYEQIKARTANVTAGGSTSIGCGLDYLTQKGIQVDGIAIISDGGQNQAPDFTTAYAKYVKTFDTEPTVYFYSTAGDRNVLTQECIAAKLPIEQFDLRGTKLDFYSLPNLVQTMRVSRYSLADEILACPLATLDQVLDKTVGMEVLRGATRAVPA